MPRNGTKAASRISDSVHWPTIANNPLVPRRNHSIGSLSVSVSSRTQPPGAASTITLPP